MHFDLRTEQQHLHHGLLNLGGCAGVGLAEKASGLPVG